MKQMTFPEYLTDKYLGWQKTLGKRKTLEEFANYIGVSRPLLNMWLNGDRSPGSDNLKLLAQIFGLEVYDVLGKPRPDSFLLYVQKTSTNLKENQKRKLEEQIAKYITENAKESPPSR